MDIFSLKVFPPANVFEMLPEDELQQLADDIKANGLHEPLIVAEIEKEQMLIDGRNRREACKIAGVKPEVRMLNGEDPKAFVASANLRRRHSTKSQRAAAMAMLYPEPEKGGRGIKSVALRDSFDKTLLSRARFVLAHAPDLMREIISGGKSVQEQYEKVRQLIDDANTDEAKIAQLKQEAPDLADLVVEGMKLTEAMAAKKKRDEERAQQRALVTRALAEAINALNPGAGTSKTWAEHVVEFFDPDQWADYAEEKQFSPELIKDSIASLTELRKLMEKSRGRPQADKTHHAVGGKTAHQNKK